MRIDRTWARGARGEGGGPGKEGTLTYDGQIHPLFPRRRVPEVHPAPIDALVLALEPVDGEVSWIRRRDEKSSWSQCRGRRPETGVVERPATAYVEAATIDANDRSVSAVPQFPPWTVRGATPRRRLSW